MRNRLKELSIDGEPIIRGQVDDVAVARFQDRVQKNLGFKVTIVRPSYGTLIRLVRSDDGLEIGYLIYNKQDNVLNIESIKVPTFKDKRVSEYLMVNLLKDNPDVTSIKTVLIDNNEARASKTLREANRLDPNHDHCIEALMDSPAYQMRARLGFSRILDHTCKGGFAFTVGR